MPKQYKEVMYCANDVLINTQSIKIVSLLLIYNVDILIPSHEKRNDNLNS